VRLPRERLSQPDQISTVPVGKDGGGSSILRVRRIGPTLQRQCHEPIGREAQPGGKAGSFEPASPAEDGQRRRHGTRVTLGEHRVLALLVVYLEVVGRDRPKTLIAPFARVLAVIAPRIV